MWAEVIQSKCIKFGAFLEVEAKNSYSTFWKGINYARSLIAQGLVVALVKTSKLTFGLVGA